MDAKPDIWFSDCEVYAYDLIWVFISKRTGQVVVYHNDTRGVERFFDSQPNLWLCGYNFRDYDQYIAKGTLLHYNNEQLKELNDAIIFGTLQDAWDYLGNAAWDVTVPPIIDLFHDIVPRKSLKEIEGNIGMNVVETGVSFDIDLPLTPEELEEAIKYCIHDVEATRNLYYERLDYLSTKKTLCEVSDLDDAAMMKNTNARVVSEALHAQHCDPIGTFGTEYYDDVLPRDIINYDALPEIVQDFVSNIDTFSGWHDECEPILFDLWGVPTVMGIGGIHASTGYIYDKTFKSGPRKGLTVQECKQTPTIYKPDRGRLLLIQDIGSFYPSMMLKFGFLSRGIPKEFLHLFQEFYDSRMEAKAEAARCEARGDLKGAKKWKKRADAAKLVLNTVYGCLKNQYNKLYDPFMGTCVCITGQLLIIDLMNRIHDAVPTVEIIQLNTDGWVLSIDPNTKDALDCVVNQWIADTGFTVDTDIINQLWQRDVNNYVMEFDTGEIKAKGGVVKNWKGGDFKSNSGTIIDEALVKHMIYGESIPKIINDCSDLSRFQLILKAGSTYDHCEKGHYDNYTWDGTSIPGRVHRIYATKATEPTAGQFVKVKGSSVSKFADSPEYGTEDFNIKSVAQIDKRWYTELAEKKLRAFIGIGE